MNAKLKHDWNDTQKFLDDTSYHEEDARLFKDLLTNSGVAGGESSLALLTPGQILKGRIVEITKDFVVVDVGLKSEGIIPAGEFTDPEELCIDREIEVFLDQTEGEDGQIVLSREKARRQRQWEYLTTQCKEGSIIRGKVVRKVKGGLMVDIGMEAFLPGSQIDNRKIKNLDEFLGQEYDFKIIKINTDRKNIVVSRRELLEDERNTRKAELLENIQEGEIRRGIVRNITEWGAFLDIDGIDGLLHITDMSWKRLKHPSELLQPGQEIDVVVLRVEREKGRVALGLKQLEENPWEEIEQRYPPGTRVKGRIVSLAPYGAFLEIEPGIEGLIHNQEMSWTRQIADPSEMVKKGQEVEAVVIGVQKDEGRISLSIKQLEHNPWEEVEEKYPVGSNVEVEVKNFTNFGAFVDLEPGVSGLIRTSDISWHKKISHPSELLKKGDKVKALVLSIDRESQKITLGLKQLSENPWETIEKSMPVGSLVTGTITKLTAFGAYVELMNGLEGLVHVTELSDQPFGKVTDVVHKGDTVTAKVMKVDPEHNRIELSIKEYLIEKNKMNRDDIVVGGKKGKGKASKSTTEQPEE